MRATMPVKLRGGGVSDTTPSPTSPSQGGPLCPAAGASARPRCRCAGPGNPPAMPPALLLRRRRSVKIWELQGQDQSTRCHPLDRSPRWTHTSSGSSFPSRCVALGRPGRARSRCLALALREALARASDPAARGHPSLTLRPSLTSSYCFVLALRRGKGMPNLAAVAIEHNGLPMALHACTCPVADPLFPFPIPLGGIQVLCDGPATR